MQSLMGETTAVAHGGNPQDRAASPRPRCIAAPCSLFPVPCSLKPINLYLMSFIIARIPTILLRDLRWH
ncbi:MAG: hypothetical protein F6J98_26720 [Moorea sp. SIO4G2]|nr:hypothetical protein [Moorena sp. SIO4G2]